MSVCSMKRLLKVVLTAVILITGVNQAAAQNGGYFLVKSNINANMGFDLGISLNDLIGVKAGMMVDIYRPDLDGGSYEKALGHKYRLSYTAGPYIMLNDWFSISAAAGYGEIGTYGYSEWMDMYGISGKIKGLEVGLQLQFTIDGMFIELGYGTLPGSFSLGRPFHDITFGIGSAF